MKKSSMLLAAALMPLIANCSVTFAAEGAAAPAGKILLDMQNRPEKRLKVASGQVTVAASQDPAAPGVLVTIQPGKEGYPGVSLQPDGAAAWDLSAFGHVEARVVNTGSKPMLFALRVDNAGDWHDNPWNTEQTYLQPGKSATVTTIFGHSYGHKPSYALKAAAVVNLLMFTVKSDAVVSFRLESLVAGGAAGEKPPVDPLSIRIKPDNGILFGEGVAVDAAKQIVSKGAQGSLLPGTGRLRVVFTADKKDQSVALKPAVGRWDLRDCLEACLTVRNAGQTPVTPRVCLESNGGPTDWITTAAPLAPGAEQQITVPFINATIWNGQKGTGNRFLNDAVSAVVVSTEHGSGEQAIEVQSIRAAAPAAAELPDWLGKRPPVPGDWVKTFDDEFDGSEIDASKWNVYGENYWDKQSHFCKANTIIGGGVVRLRFEKKPGHQNDDPQHKRVTDYATGYLDTYGKWTQRYGYFEARMKLPTAPGLWPAFWMMPDRGAAAGPHGKRQDTGNGGMEFDIMEYLTRWGPYRYNIAMHWNGYGKDHKSTGSDKIYVQPDKDGYITCGLLWTPGSAIYYGNGREVLRWEDEHISHVPSLMMFTLPMGGWDNNSLDDKRLPDDFLIDWVRVWQRKDLASPTDGPQPAAK